MLVNSNPIDVEAPDAASPPTVGPSIEVDEILSAAAAERQREAMEEELRAQSSALPEYAQHAMHDVPGAAPAESGARRRGDACSMDEWLSLRGWQLVDAAGAEVGTIGEVYSDEASQQPEWIGVDVDGVLGSKRVVAPVHGSFILDNKVSVPYSRELVLGSGAGEALITGDHERALYERYAIPYSRDLSPTGLPAGTGDETSEAVPEGAFLSEMPGSPMLVPESTVDLPLEPQPVLRFPVYVPTDGAPRRRIPVRPLLIGAGVTAASVAAMFATRRLMRRR